MLVMTLKQSILYSLFYKFSFSLVLRKSDFVCTSLDKISLRLKDSTLAGVFPSPTGKIFFICVL